MDGFSINDYIRGIWDGDGSVGFTATNIPFASFTTYSVPLRDFVEKYLSTVVGNTNHHFTKPKRDNVYNIRVITEDAVKLTETIYPSDIEGTSIKRKFDIAQSIKKWERPVNLRKREAI